MWMLIGLFVAFILTVVLGIDATRSDKTGIRKFRLISGGRFTNSFTGPSIVHGLLRKIAFKTALILLFPVIGKRRKGVLKKKPLRESEIRQLEKIIGFLRDAEEDPVLYFSALTLIMEASGEIRWTLLYALNYYLKKPESDISATEAWKSYLAGLTSYLIRNDDLKATGHLKKASDSLFLPACKELGDIYFHSGNIEKAFSEIQKASEREYIPAIHQAGYYTSVCAEGKLFQNSVMNEAAGYFFKGAELGFPVSLWTLGELYLNGYGNAIAPDPFLALEYLQAAVEAGEDKAVDMRDKARRMTDTPKNYILGRHSYSLSVEKSLYDITTQVVKKIRNSGSSNLVNDNKQLPIIEMISFWENKTRLMTERKIGFDERRSHYCRESVIQLKTLLKAH